MQTFTGQCYLNKETLIALGSPILFPGQLNNSIPHEDATKENCDFFKKIDLVTNP